MLDAFHLQPIVKTPYQGGVTDPVTPNDLFLAHLIFFDTDSDADTEKGNYHSNDSAGGGQAGSSNEIRLSVTWITYGAGRAR